MTCARRDWRLLPPVEVARVFLQYLATRLDFLVAQSWPRVLHLGLHPMSERDYLRDVDPVVTDLLVATGVFVHATKTGLAALGYMPDVSVNGRGHPIVHGAHEVLVCLDPRPDSLRRAELDLDLVVAIQEVSGGDA